jgi:hypothetical protein
MLYAFLLSAHSMQIFEGGQSMDTCNCAYDVEVLLLILHQREKQGRRGRGH